MERRRTQKELTPNDSNDQRPSSNRATAARPSRTRSATLGLQPRGESRRHSPYRAEPLPTGAQARAVARWATTFGTHRPGWTTTPTKARPDPTRRRPLPARSHMEPASLQLQPTLVGSAGPAISRIRDQMDRPCLMMCAKKRCTPLAVAPLGLQSALHLLFTNRRRAPLRNAETPAGFPLPVPTWAVSRVRPFQGTGASSRPKKSLILQCKCV